MSVLRFPYIECGRRMAMEKELETLDASERANIVSGGTGNFFIYVRRCTSTWLIYQHSYVTLASLIIDQRGTARVTNLKLNRKNGHEMVTGFTVTETLSALLHQAVDAATSYSITITIDL